jgi:hypothetical protein
MIANLRQLVAFTYRRTTGKCHRTLYSSPKDELKLMLVWVVGMDTREVLDSHL